MKKIFFVLLIMALTFSFNVKVEAISISHSTFIPTLVEANGTDTAGNGTTSSDTGTTNTGTTSTGTGTGVGCEEIGGEFTKWLSDAFKIVQYVGVGLAIVLTAVDFIQVIGGSKDDDLKKAFDRSIKRLVAVILLLLTSVLVTFIVSTFLDPVIDTDIPNCVKDI